MTTVSNFLTSRVSELPDYISKNRNISAIGSAEGATSAPTEGVVCSDGTIWTGFYPTWKSLSQEEKNEVTAERKKKGIAARTGGKGGKPIKKKDEFRKLKKIIAKGKRKIASLKKTVHFEKEDDEKEKKGENEAGDQFGGKRSKKDNK